MDIDKFEEYLKDTEDKDFNLGDKIFLCKISEPVVPGDEGYSLKDFHRLGSNAVSKIVRLCYYYDINLIGSVEKTNGLFYLKIGEKFFYLFGWIWLNAYTD